MAQSDLYETTDSDWRQRRLCSDGNCIGVIDSNGFCKECGKKAIDSDSFDNAGAQGIPSGDISDDPVDAIDSVAEEVEIAQDPDWSNRRLCRDGNCIGVIGENGLCKECGKPGL